MESLKYISLLKQYCCVQEGNNTKHIVQKNTHQHKHNEDFIPFPFLAEHYKFKTPYLNGGVSSFLTVKLWCFRTTIISFIFGKEYCNHYRISVYEKKAHSILSSALSLSKNKGRPWRLQSVHKRGEGRLFSLLLL